MQHWHGDAGDHRHEAAAGGTSWRREGDEVVRLLVERVGQTRDVIAGDPHFAGEPRFLHESVLALTVMEEAERAGMQTF